MSEFNSQETVKTAERRIKVIQGQLNGLLRMIENDEYCIDLLTQSSAIQNSLKSLDTLLLERHLHLHVAHQFSSDKDTAIKELLKVFKQKSKQS